MIMKFIKFMRGKFLTFSLLLFSLVMVDYSLNKPTVINKYIATRVMSDPANNSFADNNFYACVVDGYNKENDGFVAYTDSLSKEQLAKITELKCAQRNIYDTSGLETVTNLEELNLTGNQLTSINLTSNVNLKELDLGYMCVSYTGGVSCWQGNNITSIDLSKNINLEYLDMPRNQLETIDLSNNTKLKEINLQSNKLTSFILPETENGFTLEIGNLILGGSGSVGDNTFEQLVINNGSIKSLTVQDSGINSINIKYAPRLESLSAGTYASYNTTTRHPNQITSFEVSKDNTIKELYLGNNPLVDIDVTNLKELKTLSLGQTQISTLDLSANSKLESLNVNGSKLTSLNLNNNPNINEVLARSNQLSSIVFGGVENLELLDVFSNKLTSLNLNGANKLTELNAEGNNLQRLDITDSSLLETLDVSYKL